MGLFLLTRIKGIREAILGVHLFNPKIVWLDKEFPLKLSHKSHINNTCFLQAQPLKVFWLTDFIPSD